LGALSRGAGLELLLGREAVLGALLAGALLAVLLAAGGRLAVRFTVEEVRFTLEAPWFTFSAPRAGVWAVRAGVVVRAGWLPGRLAAVLVLRDPAARSADEMGCD